MSRSFFQGSIYLQMNWCHRSKDGVKGNVDSCLTVSLVPRPLPLFRTASDGKLGKDWERG